MYTMIWTEHGGDRWDRFTGKEDVTEKLNELKEDGGVSIGDVWIFSPEADNFALTGYDYISE